ncbi:MAG: GAF domain-containing sensor histidine kinase [Gemmatimonadota bacterium]
MTDARTPAISEDRLKTLVEVGLLLTSEMSLDGVLQRLADHSARLLGARYAAIGVLDSVGTGLQSFYTSGVDEDLRRQIGDLPKGHGILGVLIREPRALRLPDIAHHADSFGFPPHHPPMKSFLGAPIVGRRGVFGNIYLTEKIAGENFTDEDAELVVLLAAQAAAAVDNAKLHEESARLLEEVQGLHRSRERFFAMVNHELRNALAATYGWAEMLVRKKDPSTVPRAAYEVLDSAGQAIALISDLLDLSRLDEDRLHPVVSPVEPAAMVQRAISRTMPLAESMHITLAAAPDAALPPIQTDPHRVEQILTNLLGNAVRHSPAGTHVRVEVRAEAACVMIYVIDQGPGIEADQLERVFDVYVTNAGEEGRGTGLGLPLSRRLARLLGGELRALRRENEGGCFVLELPITPDLKGGTVHS